MTESHTRYLCKLSHLSKSSNQQSADRMPFGMASSCVVNNKLSLDCSVRYKYPFLYMFMHNRDNFGVFICYLQTWSIISPASSCYFESRQWRSTGDLHSANEDHSCSSTSEQTNTLQVYKTTYWLIYQKAIIVLLQ